MRLVRLRRPRRVAQKVALAASVLVLACQLWIGPVHAQEVPSDSGLNDSDINAVYGGWPVWDPSACNLGSSSSTGINQVAGQVDAKERDREKIAFEFFIANGFTAAQAAGIIGNMVVESNVTPDDYQVGGPAYGIVQWQDSRLINMRSWVTSHGGDPKTLGGQKGKPVGQLDYIIQELNTTESMAKTQIKKVNNPKDAAFAWGIYYERFDQKNASMPVREADAQDVYDYAVAHGWSTDTAGASVEDTNGASCGSSPVGNGTIPTGTAQQLATQILSNNNITFQDDPNGSERAAMKYIASTGHGRDCGGPAMDPRLLGVILAMAQQFKIVIGVLDDGHGCDGLNHPKGKAVDLNGVNPLPGAKLSQGLTGTGNRIDWTAAEMPIMRAFITYVGTLLSSLNTGKAPYVGGLGQEFCFTGAKPTYAQYVNYFDDTCNHQHVDVGDYQSVGR